MNYCDLNEYEDYIENIATVEFNSFPTDNMLVMGPDSDT